VAVHDLDMKAIMSNEGMLTRPIDFGVKHAF
jgi:hypothetical protein